MNNILTYGGRPIDYGKYLPERLIFFNNDFSISRGNCVWYDLQGRCLYAYNIGVGNRLKEFDGTTWNEIPLEGIDYFEGSNVWTNGEYMFLSDGSNRQYVIYYRNGGLSLEPFEWGGYNNMIGYCIWKDGNNIYYSFGTDHYVLDIDTYTWSQKTWYGLNEFYGDNVWTDGENIYYSSGSTHKVLDRATSTWSTKNWNFSMSEWISIQFDGADVWTISGDIYYSNFYYMYRLDKSTSTWYWLQNESAQATFYGKSVWKYGGRTYVNGFYWMGEDFWHGNVPGNPHYYSSKYEIKDGGAKPYYNFINDNEVNP